MTKNAWNLNALPSLTPMQMQLLFYKMEGTIVTIFDDPCSDPDCFPVFGEYMKALQDP